MDDFDEERYREVVEAGRHNLQAKKLLVNWCFHAEFVRSPGRGLIEAETGLPIGHMGVQCKFSKKNSIHCWLLEDAAYDFYLSNCKDCGERVPVGLPNIMSFIGPREEAASERRKARDNDEKERKKKHLERVQERAEIRYELSLEETFVLDLLDQLDNEDIATDDPRLEQLANLAPETFTRKVIEHLLPAVLHEHLPYSVPAARALFRTPLEPNEKLAIAVRLVSNYEKSENAIEEILSNAEKLSRGDLKKVLSRFVHMALGPPPDLGIGEIRRVTLDSGPARSLFKKRREDILVEVEALFGDESPANIGAAVEIILATESDELLLKHIRSVFAKLMRRRTLLPSERQDSSVLYYLREAASRCLENYPKKTDAIIQSYLADNDDTGKQEAQSTYRSVLKHNFREKAHIGSSQRIAFSRLLWAAAENPVDYRGDAGQFFRQSWEEFSQLAVEYFDELIGAAATLSERYEQAGAESSLDLPENMLAYMDKNNKLNAIHDLQEGLIDWAAVGAKSKGREGIEEFLEIYRQLPSDQTQMRGNMIVHISKLLTGVESLTLVLSDWYRALMDESTVVRASAVQAWENVPYDMVKNFPDLFFEAFSVLLGDPYIIVHRSAVRALRRRSFPEEKRQIIKNRLWNLIVYYSQESKQEDFIVDCIDAFAFLCLSHDERQGELGGVLSGILFTLDGSALYHAVNRLHYGFKDVPGFAKVALKSIQNDYTRSISIDDCVSAILSAPQNELQKCVDDIKKAFEALQPYRPESFVESLLYVAALTKAGNYAVASSYFKELLERIPLEDRYDQWRLEIALIISASDIEQTICNMGDLTELIENWSKIKSDLEKENEERAKLRDFPPSFLFEN
jgi:hypothetical protein